MPEIPGSLAFCMCYMSEPQEIAGRVEQDYPFNGPLTKGLINFIGFRVQVLGFRVDPSSDCLGL